MFKKLKVLSADFKEFHDNNQMTLKVYHIFEENIIRKLTMTTI